MILTIKNKKGKVIPTMKVISECCDINKFSCKNFFKYINKNKFTVEVDVIYPDDNNKSYSNWYNIIYKSKDDITTNIKKVRNESMLNECIFYSKEYELSDLPIISSLIVLIFVATQKGKKGRSDVKCF